MDTTCFHSGRRREVKRVPLTRSCRSSIAVPSPKAWSPGVSYGT